MALWVAHPLPNREDELFAAIVTDESGKQLIGQFTSFGFAERIVFLHNADKPAEDAVEHAHEADDVTPPLCEYCGTRHYGYQDHLLA